jgi:hypothetical protein
MLKRLGLVSANTKSPTKTFTKRAEKHAKMMKKVKEQVARIRHFGEMQSEATRRAMVKYRKFLKKLKEEKGPPRPKNTRREKSRGPLSANSRRATRANILADRRRRFKTMRATPAHMSAISEGSRNNNNSMSELGSKLAKTKLNNNNL